MVIEYYVFFFKIEKFYYKIIIDNVSISSRYNVKIIIVL